MMRAIIALVLSALPVSAAAQQLLHPMFQDHAVLQRDQPLRVFGRSASGTEVTVTVAGATARARADAAGQWQAVLPALPAGGPHTLTARTSSSEQIVRDVMIGDVWLCSGQSNMVLQVHRTLDSRAEIANSANDRIRMLAVGLASSPAPQTDFAAPVKWEVAAPATVPEWSATCFYFARELQKTVDVPMGMVNASWGGSNIQTWMSEAGLRAVGGYDDRLDVLRLYATDQSAAMQRWGQVWETWWRSRVPAAPDAEPWAARVADNGEWRNAPAALGFWETWGMPELASFNGMVWYRADIELSAAQAAQDATLSLGAVDEIDLTWVNARVIGGTSGAGTRRNYRIPRGTLHAGTNVIVVNALDTYATGGLYGAAPERALRLADGTSIPLSVWRFRIVPPRTGSPPRMPWEATGGFTTIHNAMIVPIGPYNFRGVVWYQGESNTDAPEQYQRLLAGLMSDWRAKYGANLPFLIVQLANYGPAATAPTNSGWARLREAQRLAVLDDGHAGLAVTIDLGDRYDIHPANKQEVGRRLARAARHVIYGEAIAPSGPVPTGARRHGSDVVVSFADVQDQLVAYGADAPIGFELCGTDQSTCRFVTARMDASSVRLAIPAGPVPTRVRFCWADSPVCTLYDRAGLPAGPFELVIQE